MKKIDRLSDRLEKTLTVVFQNEVQKGLVYESVYEEKKETPLTRAAIATRIESPSSIPDELHTQITNLLDLTQFKIKSLSTIKSPLVETPNLIRNKEQVTLSFTVKNTKQQTRTEGVIWMLMEWINADGTVLKVSTQDSRDPQAVYSIRQQKIKKLTFKMPNSTAVLSKLELFFKSRDGQILQFQILPKHFI